MSDITDWGISASSSANSVAAPNGWPDNQAPSTVKTTGREMMAAIRRNANDQPWFDWGDSVSQISATTFKVTGFVKSRYNVNRRLRLGDATDLYGSVTDATTSGSDTIVTVVVDDSAALTSSLSKVSLASIVPLALPPTVETGNNILINGDFVVSQRGTTFTSTGGGNSDGAITIDRWALLSQASDVIDISKDTTLADLPAGSRSAAKMLVATANNKAGILQIIENKDSVQAVGGVVSFSFKAKKSAGTPKLDKLRVGILGWSGAADSVTRDVVDASWNAEGVNPSLAASWNYINTPADIELSTTYKTFQIESVAVGTSFNNLGVFIWIDNSDASAGEACYITDCQLNLGATASRFLPRHFGDELALCQRYYEKSYDVDTDPGTSATLGSVFITSPYQNDGSQGNTQPDVIQVDFHAPKRATSPTIKFYNVGGTPDQITCGVHDRSFAAVTSVSRVIAGGTNEWTQAYAGQNRFMYHPNTNSTPYLASPGAQAISQRGFMRFHYTVDSEL